MLAPDQEPNASLRHAQDTFLDKLREAKRHEKRAQRRAAWEESWASAPMCFWRWFRGKFVGETLCPVALMSAVFLGWGLITDSLDFASVRFFVILCLAYIIIMGPGPGNSRKQGD